MKRLVIGFVLLTASSLPLAAKQVEGLVLEQGALTRSPNYVRQLVSLSNQSNRYVKSAKIECAFFDGNKLIGSGLGFVDNLEKGELGSVEVIANSNVAATSSKCRLVTVE